MAITTNATSWVATAAAVADAASGDACFVDGILEYRRA